MADLAKLITTAKLFIPTQFLTLCSDPHIEAFLNVTLSEANIKPPLTGYGLNTMPPSWDMLIVFGAQMYATLFMQASYTLQDFTYSDGGLSLSIDRTAKMGVPLANMMSIWNRHVIDMKKVAMLQVQPVVLATPSFSPVFSQMITSLFPGNIPMR